MQVDVFTLVPHAFAWLTEQRPVWEIEIRRGKREEPGKYLCVFEEIAELAVRREQVFETGSGRLGLSAVLFQDGQKLEEWPEHQPLEFEVPENRQEMFWPL